MNDGISGGLCVVVPSGFGADDADTDADADAAAAAVAAGAGAGACGITVFNGLPT